MLRDVQAEVNGSTLEWQLHLPPALRSDGFVTAQNKLLLVTRNSDERMTSIGELFRPSIVGYVDQATILHADTSQSPER